MAAKTLSRLSGATKRARPVASVVNLSPLVNSTVTPGVSRPLTSSTAKVARSPLTNFRGSRRIRALEAGGADCAKRARVTKRKRAKANQRLGRGFDWDGTPRL